MVGRILQSPQFSDVTGPLIYLGGPVQGTYDWRSDAIAYITLIDEKIPIANPRCRSFQGEYGVQLSWCERYQDQSAENGALLFWFSRETNHRCNRAYAQEARFELGERAGRSWQEGTKIVVGIERGFTGYYYLWDKLSHAYPNIPLCRTLRQTCAAAVEMATGRSSKWSDVRERLI